MILNLKKITSLRMFVEKSLNGIVPVNTKLLLRTSTLGTYQGNVLQNYKLQGHILGPITLIFRVWKFTFPLRNFKVVKSCCVVTDCSTAQ